MLAKLEGYVVDTYILNTVLEILVINVSDSGTWPEIIQQGKSALARKADSCVRSGRDHRTTLLP